MNDEIYEEAKRLASRPYYFKLSRDDDADPEVRYSAYNPDIEGCIGQGATIKEAVEDLRDARIDLFEFLLERGQSIPDPTPLSQISEIHGVANWQFMFENQVVIQQEPNTEIDNELLSQYTGNDQPVIFVSQTDLDSIKTQQQSEPSKVGSVRTLSFLMDVPQFHIMDKDTTLRSNAVNLSKVPEKTENTA